MDTNQTIDSRLAEAQQIQQQLAQEPVIGKLKPLKNLVYKLTHSTFSRQFNLNNALLNFIGAVYQEVVLCQAQIAELRRQLGSVHQQLGLKAEESVPTMTSSNNSNGPDPLEKIKHWISSSVKDKSFADVGGIGVNAMNERISLAVLSEAKSATMIDIRPKTYYEWDLFRQRCAEQGVTSYNSIDCIDINDPLMLDKVGMYDIVHCTGIMYHMPCPVWSLYNLTRIVKDILIINTVIVPPRIETEYGSLEFSGNQVLFLPGISERERLILKSYYQRKFGWSIDDYAPALYNQTSAKMPWLEDGKFSCWPYWWLFTENSFKGLVNMMGFDVLDSSLWENHALAFLAKKVKQVEAIPPESMKKYGA